MTTSMILTFACVVGVSALLPGNVPVMRPASAHARAVPPPALTATSKEDGALRISQHGAVGRRAILLGAGALAFSQSSPAWAAGKNPKKEDLSTSLFKLTFEQSKSLAFEKLGWGDKEMKILSQALTRDTATTKLILANNDIEDTGVAALAQSLRSGVAPNLKMINLAGNGGVTQAAAQGLVAAREGLTVSFEQPPVKKDAGDKQISRTMADAVLNPDRRTLYKLAFEQAETLFFSELGWGDDEAVALSKELPAATSLKKLFLNGNAIQCDGGQALAASIRSGGAPKLKILNLAGNRGLTEADRRELLAARKGLTVNFVQLKQASDAEVYIRADEGKLTNKGVIERASSGKLVEGSGATCAELDQIMNVDRATIKVEQNLLKNMKDPEVIAKTEALEQSLERQVERLEGLKKAKVAKDERGCSDDKARLARSSGYPLLGTTR
tara:strand:+ start:2857 stop:4182 length:1326 start_codon:yes stop_codon:yes gene_type:complete